jgi:phosphoribosylamine--glycine ligase
MGDPECQTILPKLKTDFFKVLSSCVEKKLELINLEWGNEKSLCIVLCSKGYPEEYRNNIEIENLNKIYLKNEEFIFHAGTKSLNSKTFSKGGRVLNFVVISKDFKECRNIATNLIKELNWPNGFYRKDIGFKVIN